MATKRADDLLQNYSFFLADISPSGRPPFFVMGGEQPLGFNTCSMPELTLDVQEITEYNNSYKTYYYTGASVGALTLTRGMTSKDSTLYRWVMRSLKGTDKVQRNLLLLHYSGLRDAQISADQDLLMARGFGKGYLLMDCIPTRYKPGEDFDATSGDVSIGEIEIQPRYFIEFSLDIRNATDII